MKGQFVFVRSTFVNLTPHATTVSTIVVTSMILWYWSVWSLLMLKCWPFLIPTFDNQYKIIRI